MDWGLEVMLPVQPRYRDFSGSLKETLDMHAHCPWDNPVNFQTTSKFWLDLNLSDDKTVPLFT